MVATSVGIVFYRLYAPKNVTFYRMLPTVEVRTDHFHQDIHSDDVRRYTPTSRREHLRNGVNIK